jgi:RNA polymerase sigma-70 factor (ECF subfamily)
MACRSGPGLVDIFLIESVACARSRQLPHRSAQDIRLIYLACLHQQTPNMFRTRQPFARRLWQAHEGTPAKASTGEAGMQIVDTLPIASRTCPTAAPRTSSDESLIRLVAGGHKRALEVLFKRHNVRVYRFVLRFTGDAALAEDIVSEVFIDVWRNAGKFESRSQVSTWLLAIGRYKALTALRERRETQWDEEKAANVADEAHDPEVIAHQASLSVVIQKCLMQLPAYQREIIDLVYYHGKSVSEVAQIAGIPEGTVKSRIFHARCRMVRLLQEAGVHSMRLN